VHKRRQAILDDFRYLLTLQRFLVLCLHIIIKKPLTLPLLQGSQKRGPRECPMRPVNIRKNEILKEILSHFAYLSKYIDF